VFMICMYFSCWAVQGFVAVSVTRIRERRVNHDCARPQAELHSVSPATSFQFPVSHAHVTWVGLRVNANDAAEDRLHVVGTQRWNRCCFLVQRYIYAHKYFNTRALLVLARVCYLFLTVCVVNCSLLQWGGTWCGTEFDDDDDDI
jgi:hypothetical protein